MAKTLRELAVAHTSALMKCFTPRQSDEDFAARVATSTAAYGELLDAIAEAESVARVNRGVLRNLTAATPADLEIPVSLPSSR